MPLKEVVGNFLEYIQFHKIPANVLMREIHPLGLVPYSIIMNALAYQVLLCITCYLFVRYYDGSLFVYLNRRIRQVLIQVIYHRIQVE